MATPPVPVLTLLDEIPAHMLWNLESTKDQGCNTTTYCECIHHIKVNTYFVHYQYSKLQALTIPPVLFRNAFTDMEDYFYGCTLQQFTKITVIKLSTHDRTFSFQDLFFKINFPVAFNFILIIA